MCTELSIGCIELQIFNHTYIQCQKLRKYLQYVGLFVCSWPIFLLMMERIFVLNVMIIKSRLWFITHCWGLCYEILFSFCVVYYITTTVFLLLFTKSLSKYIPSVPHRKRRYLPSKTYTTKQCNQRFITIIWRSLPFMSITRPICPHPHWHQL